MSSNQEIDLKETPLLALGFKAKQILSDALDKHKILPSPSGLPRDYRGLAELAGVSFNDIRNPTQAVLASWSRVEPVPSLGDLVKNLELIDRWDVIEDVLPALEIDSLNHSLKQKQLVAMNSRPSPSPEEKVITYDDADLLKIGLPPSQMYDAYLLYADQDEHIALDIVSRLEKEFRLKICVKDRDIMGSVGFEHEAITYLISQRCNWLIVVLTPNFIDCPAQNFIYNYSIASGLSEGQKIIPCLFRQSGDAAVNKRLREVTYSTWPINFVQENIFRSNWDRLGRAVSAPRVVVGEKSARASTSVSTKREIMDSEIAQTENVKKEDKGEGSCDTARPAPDPPPRSKHKSLNSPSPSPSRQKLDSAKSSEEVSKESCSSTNSNGDLLPCQPDKGRSSISSLLTDLKKTKLAKTCQNFVKKKKKIPVALAS